MSDSSSPNGPKRSSWIGAKGSSGSADQPTDRRAARPSGSSKDGAGASTSRTSRSRSADQPRSTSRTTGSRSGASRTTTTRAAAANAKRSGRTERTAGAGAATGAATSGAASRGTAKRGAAGAGTVAAVTGKKGAPARGAKGAGTARRGAAAAAAAGASRARPKKSLINYPRAGKKGIWRWLPSFRLLTMAAALLVLAGVGFSWWFYSVTTIPKPTDVALAQTSKVYFSDGKTPMGEFSDINRTILPSDQVPQNVKDAVVASEDSTFYENRGVSPKGIVRALINNVRGGDRQGASTITQQYVENYYTGKTTSYSDKAREAVMAIKIDQELSKDEILSRYLNTIYFGRGAYGIEAASQAYFGKPAKDLTDSEAALLVAIIPSPSAWDPQVNEKKAKERWARVISRQVNDTKTLTTAEADALEFPKTIDYKPTNKLGGTNGYLLAMVKSELERQGIPADRVDTGGFTIISTIDPKMQNYTVEAIKNLPESRPASNHVGTMTIEPSTGAIKAMYGGKDFVTQARNDATQSRMQGGSIFKTFTLVAALENGYSLNSMWEGNSPQQFHSWRVKNFGDIDYGKVSLTKATEHSVNTAYAELNIEMGPDQTRQAAIKLGLPENTPGLDSEATNVLGTASPTVREMASAYATLASGGIYREPYIVQTVKNPDGSMEYEHKDNGKRVIDEGVATNATVALQGPPGYGGSAKWVAQHMDGRPVAGKTGTSESFRSAWFVGYTPQLVTAVGMFQPSADGKVEEQLTPFGDVQNMTGGGWPTRIWVDIMKPSMEGMEFLSFPKAVKLKNQKSTRVQTKKPSPSSTKAPTIESPTTEAPTTEAPTTEAPTTEAPTTEAPTTPAPTTQAPTTPAPKPTTTQAPKPTKAPPGDQPTDQTPNGRGQGNGGGNGTTRGNGIGPGSNNGNGDKGNGLVNTAPGG